MYTELIHKLSSIILNHFHTQSRQTLGSLTAQYLFNNIQINFSLHIRLIFSFFYIYLALTFVHLFTGFKISLSLHLYNINSTVLSHLTAASLEASIIDSSLIICFTFHTSTDVFEPQSSKLTDGLNMHQKSSCGFLSVRAVRWQMDGPLISLTWERSFTL